MKSLDLKTVLIAGLVVVVILGADRAGEAGASSVADSNSDMIAVTGEYGNGTSVLWLIDTKSKQLAVYRSMSGNSVALVGARRIEHDLKLLDYQDRSPSSLHPSALEKRYRDFLKKRSGKSDSTAFPAPPASSDDGKKK